MDNKRWLARVDFMDHAECGASNVCTIPISVWGLIVKETDSEIHLLYWCADKDEKNHNSEVWAIVKHPGIRIDKIRKESI